jgi:hypothetical protein
MYVIAKQCKHTHMPSEQTSTIDNTDFDNIEINDTISIQNRNI